MRENGGIGAMSSGLEAVGDAASGAVLAGAVEPGHGAAGHDGHGACANCGTALVGPYCHGCGQNGHIHRSLAGFGHDLLHGVFHFEGKIWHTLPLLFFKPGELTRRYVAGERAKFVSPMAMFLFCVFLMFAVVGGLAGSMNAPEVDAVHAGKSLAQIETELTARRAEAKALTERIRRGEEAQQDVRALETRLETVEAEIDGLETAQELASSVKAAGDGVVRTTVKGGDALKVETGWPLLDHGIAAANENPNLFLYRLQSSAYKYSWALIPLSTPLIWLLFCWKRQYKFYDHLIFVTFSLTFMMLLVTLLTLLGAVGAPAWLIVPTVLFVPPLHMYRQLRGAYGTSRAGGLLRTAALLLFALFALILYVLILLLMGVMH